MAEYEDWGEILSEELVFKHSRSSGPGGQNVNKVNTRVTVLLDVAGSSGFTEWQKKRILKRLSSRATKEGVVRVVSQRYRTQKANRRAAVERLAELLSEALKNKPIRKKTRIPAHTKQHRLEQKRHQSRLKGQRSQRDFLED